MPSTTMRYTPANRADIDWSVYETAGPAHCASNLVPVEMAIDLWSLFPELDPAQGEATDADQVSARAHN